MSLQDIANSNELNILHFNLKKFDETLKIDKANSESIQTNVRDSYDEVVDQIKQWKAEIIKLLDDIETQLLETASALQNEIIISQTEYTSACGDFIAETEKLLKHLVDKRKLGYNSALFKSAKQTKDNLSRMREEADRIGEQCRPHRLSFCRDEKVATMLSTLGLGAVLLSKDPANIKAKYGRDIDIKYNTDTRDCTINDGAVLSDGRLCLCDHANKSIKLIDTELMEISEQLILPDEPISATVINDDEIAVIIHMSKNLQILSVSPSLRPSRTILLPEIYISIAYCEDKLLLAWLGVFDGGIDICDMLGTRIKRIETNVDGTKIFKLPRRICVSPDHSMMYVTDDAAHTVACMNMDGDVINVFKNEKLYAPWGITVDQDGNVYVCSYATDMIHHLTRTGQLVQVLLDANDEIDVPCTIVYKSGHLYISSRSTTQARSNNIKIFRLSYNW